MARRPSPASDLERLIADLEAPESIRRDAAVARLRVAGSRALPRLSAFLAATPASAARAAALNALDGIDDARAVDPALAAVDALEPDVVIAAVNVLRGWVAREDGTRVLDALAALAVDRDRDARIRLAALDALSDLPRHLVQPILEQAPPADARTPGDDPLRVREWLATVGRREALSALHDLIVRARERERTEPSLPVRHEWQTARAAVHAALAARGSRVALYDLRETFDAATAPLPRDFVVAITAIGDASCLEPLARAWAAAPGDAWWRDRLAGAATAIVRRTRLSGRSAVVKRIRAKWKGFL